MIAMPMMRRLNTLALGDEYAHQLGLRVEYTRVGIILTGSLLTAVAVSLGGLISFAGLIVPHVARLILGPDHVRLLPVTALSGAIFVIVADTLARSLFAPTRDSRGNFDGLSWRTVLSLSAAQDQAELRAMTPLLSFRDVSFGYGEIGRHSIRELRSAGRQLHGI